MKIFLKWFVLILLFLFLGLWIAIKVFSEKMPEVNPTTAADELAVKMMNVLGKEGWDTLIFLQWSFKDRHHYLWNKQENAAIIMWKDKKVIMNLNDQSGRAWIKDKELLGKDKDPLLKTAWKYWCNDSFWMFAPFKLMDPGTVRTMVDIPNKGSKGLMVTYQSGGVTPGDSYLWILNENNEPTGVKMWASILPLKGLYFSWENWLTLPEGVRLSTLHHSRFVSNKITNVKSGKYISEFGYDIDWLQ